MYTGIKRKERDYTIETVRCAKFIIQQIKQGIAVPDAILQAEQSYSYGIALNAQKSISRVLSKHV